MSTTLYRIWRPDHIDDNEDSPGKLTYDIGELSLRSHGKHWRLKMIEHIKKVGYLQAIIVRSDFRDPGVHFVTPNDLSQQLAYMRHPAGKVIDAHFHNRVTREVHYAQEVLMIRKGRLRVDFYDKNHNYIESRILEAGDTILLVEGGHGFEVLEEVEMIEVKQGPHVGEADKTRFPGISADQVRLPCSE